MNSYNVFYSTLIFGCILILSLLPISCDTLSSDSDEFEDGIHVEILEFIDDETLSIIEDSLKVTVHRGDNPPFLQAIMDESQQKMSLDSVQFSSNAIEGITVVMSPNIRIETLVPDDPIDDDGFLDYYIRLTNQDMDEYTIDVNMMHPDHDPLIGEGSYIIGDGDDFTVFSELTQEVSDEENAEMVTAQVFSGTATSEGVENANVALVMMDNAGLEDRFIPNGTGRSFEDGAGIARLTSWPEEASKIADDNLLSTARIMMWKSEN